MREIKILLIICFAVFVTKTRAQRNITEERFDSAYNEIVAMLEGEKPLSVKRSVFLSEWAYLDGKLDYEQDFCAPLSKVLQYMRRLIAVNKWDKYKTAKQIAICTFFFQPVSGNNYTIFLMISAMSILMVTGITN